MKQFSVLRNSGFEISLKQLTTLLLYSGLLFINYNFSSDYISLLCLVVSCVMMFRCAHHDLLPLALFFASFAYLFRFGQFNTYFLLQLCFIARCIIDKGTELSRYFGLFVIYVLFHIISTDLSTLRIGTFIPFVGMLTLLCAATYYDETQRTRCVQYFVVGFLIASILGLRTESNRLFTVLDENPILLGDGNLFHRFGGLVPDCNFYTMVSVIAVCIVALRYNTGLSGLLRLLILSALIGLGSITFSKSFYLCLVVIIAVMLLLDKRGNYKFIIGIIIVGFLAFNYFGESIELVLGASLDRFTTSTDDAQSFTNGRFEYWIMYLNESFEDIAVALLGHGAEALPQGHIVAHNTYLEILYKFGLLGLILDFVYLFNIKRMIVKNYPIMLSNKLPVALLLLLIFNLSAYSFYPLWSLLIICFIAWNTSKF